MILCYSSAHKAGKHQREYDEQTYALLDGSVTDEKISVCSSALLHARHNDEPFSKHAFLTGDYKDFDLGSLDITNVRDFAVFMAVSSASQGIRGEEAWQTFEEKKRGRQLSELCQSCTVHKCNASTSGCDQDLQTKSCNCFIRPESYTCICCQW